jgi:GT2 family glycosyltransferase
MSIRPSFSAQHCEIIVVVNGKDEATISFLKELPDVRTIYLDEQVGRGAARNRAFSRSSGDILYFIDDDVVVPSDRIQAIVTFFDANPTCAIVGGPNLGFPDENRWQKCMSLALASPVGAGPFFRRYKRTKKIFNCGENDLMLCNLAVRRDIFVSIQFFDNVISNEENILIQEVLKKNLSVCYSSEFYVYHQRACKVNKSFLRYFSYGRGRADNMLINPSSSLLHGIGIFGLILYILITGFFMPGALGVSIFLYALIVFSFALYRALSFAPHNRPYAIVHIPLAIVCIHSGYCGGFIFEFVRNTHLHTKSFKQQKKCFADGRD